MAPGGPLTEQQRGKFAEKLMEWGILVFVGLIVAQVTPGTGPFRLGAAIAGLVTFMSAYLAAYAIMKGV